MKERNLSKLCIVLIFLLPADEVITSNPYGNIYFAVPHIAGFQGSPLHFPYVH